MDLHVTVLGAVEDKSLGNFATDTRRVKSVLLYADSISVVSPKVPYLHGRMAAKSRLLIDALASMDLAADPGLGEVVAEGLKEYLDDAPLGEDSELGARNRAFLADLLEEGDVTTAVVAMQAVIEHIQKTGMSPTQDGQVFAVTAPVAVRNYLKANPSEDTHEARAASDDLYRLQQSGLVDFHTFGAGEVLQVAESGLILAFILAFERAIEYMLNAERTEQPLFSDGAREMITVLRDTGRLELADYKLANRAEFASRLICSIPCFPDATVDELLDVRELVAGQMERFRAAVADAADELDADLPDRAFDRAISDVQGRLVEPALEELRESLKETGALPTLLRGIPVTAGSALALGAAAAVGAPELAGAAAAAAGLTSATINELLTRRKHDNDRKKNRFFLLFAAERHLAT